MLLYWRRNLVKLEQKWDERISTLDREAAKKARELEGKHWRERKALAQVPNPDTAAFIRRQSTAVCETCEVFHL